MKKNEDKNYKKRLEKGFKLLCGSIKYGQCVDSFTIKIF